MAFEITQVLLNAQSPDGSIRKVAEDSLKQFQEQDLPNFLLLLSHELANNEKPPESRRLAGLILKNSLDAKDATRKMHLVQSWISLNDGLKAQIKGAILSTLSAEVVDARHTSAQVIAKVAGIELPEGQWPELIGSLLANMGGDQAPHLRQATLETLGYVCEEVPPNALAQDQVNALLTAVVQGMNAGETSNDIRLAATQALYNALDFAQSNFENDGERDYIMKVICEAITVCPDNRVRLAAFECLVSISSTYYEKIVPYMQELFSLTCKAVREDEEPVALQAIEFWSSVCDVEIEIQDEYGPDFAGTTDVPYYKFIKQALPALVPMLLETLTKQEEDQDQEEDVWNLAMAGGTCLGLVSRTVGNDIVPLVMPYIQENISKPDWRCREAATYAFGSILEGPSVDHLTNLVNHALPFMLNAMKDENNHVKDTTAWTLGRIFEFLHGPHVETSVVNDANLPQILGVLLEKISDVPNVSEKVCGAIYLLAQGYEEVDQASSSSPLSPFFQNIIQALLVTTDRNDAGDSRLRSSAYETLNEIIRCTTADTAAIVMQLLPVIMQKLGSTLEMQVVSTEDREKQTEVQALLCGVLQVIIQKLGSTESTKVGILQCADQLIGLFLRVFACRSSTVHEEAMLAIGALAYVSGGDFLKYMPEFYKYLEMGLQNFEEYQVCAATVGVVGDICRALDDKVLPFCDGVMSQLLTNLSSSSLHRSVKPPMFSCFGDIALAIGENFEKYLMYAMPMLQSAAELSAQAEKDDEEIIDYYNQLRVGILEAYSGILQGFKNKNSNIMAPYAAHILQFLESIYADEKRNDAVAKAAIGVLGDLADTLGPSSATLFQTSGFYNSFLEECQRKDDKSLKGIADWAMATINRITVK